MWNTCMIVTIHLMLREHREDSETGVRYEHTYFGGCNICEQIRKVYLGALKFWIVHVFKIEHATSGNLPERGTVSDSGICF
jgi:hypothetical protein